LVLFDRLLHPLRRQRVFRRLAGLPAGDVVFICQGNICRSPFAEAVFERSASELGVVTFTTQSTGFAQPGRAPPPDAIVAAREFGIDLDIHRSHPMPPHVLRNAALVVVMEHEHARRIRRRFGSRTAPMVLLGDLDPLPIEKRDIADPWGQSQGVFETCYARIDRCVRQLVRALASAGS
jgi:protein-tyrosine-phosphatase